MDSSTEAISSPTAEVAAPDATSEGQCHSLIRTTDKSFLEPVGRLLHSTTQTFVWKVPSQPSVWGAQGSVSGGFGGARTGYMPRLSPASPPKLPYLLPTAFQTQDGVGLHKLREFLTHGEFLQPLPHTDRHSVATSPATTRITRKPYSVAAKTYRHTAFIKKRTQCTLQLHCQHRLCPAVPRN